MPSTNASWHSLPAETRLQILRLLFDGCSLARFATVSREWNAIIEKHNFSRINLTPSQLNHDGRMNMLDRKQSLVRYIWFHLELQPYNCWLCEPGNRQAIMSVADDMFITESLTNLTNSLSHWNRNGDLVLNISIHSPSDSEHWFPYLDFEPDMPPSGDFFSTQDLGVPPAKPKDDRGHGWEAGRQQFAGDSSSIEKLFEEITLDMGFDGEGPQWWRQLPSVPAVTGIFLRQQTRRRWEPQALVEFLALFPNLEEIVYEPWREFTLSQQNADESQKHLINTLAKKNLRKLVIFENFNQDYPLICRHGSFGLREPSPLLSRKLARASRKLEVLSASFTVDASYFFNEACKESFTWQNLTSLAITSRLLAPDESTSERDDMLRDAAAAALNMPRIRRIEIWNGSRKVAMLFRYQPARDRQSAIITLRGTFEFDWDDRVAGAWDDVALHHRHGGVVVERSSINDIVIRSHGDAICHLRLSHVIRPVSLRQTLKEHQARARGIYDRLRRPDVDDDFGDFDDLSDLSDASDSSE